jgi:CMP/dCMP kinase
LSGRPMIVAIDGPAGSGKSSTAKALAKKLKLPYIDTGAMYRAITLHAIRSGVDLDNKKELIASSKKAHVELVGSDPKKLKVFLNKKDVTLAIREPELTKQVFHVAQVAEIRREMVKKQRRMGSQAGGVLEGRDIGTMVFPNAAFKFFFLASPEIRAKRRQKELLAVGKRLSLEQVKKELLERDKTDLERKEGPLRQAKDAFVIDTTSLTIDATVDKIVKLIRSKSFSGKD